MNVTTQLVAVTVVTIASLVSGGVAKAGQLAGWSPESNEFAAIEASAHRGSGRLEEGEYGYRGSGRVTQDSNQKPD